MLHVTDLRNKATNYVIELTHHQCLPRRSKRSHKRLGTVNEAEDSIIDNDQEQ